MSLTIRHLNGDSTFLLTFSPVSPWPLSADAHRTPGTFSILLDPWLSGPSKIWHPKFALSKHTIPSCIQHLSEIPEPNVVLISQDKPDHCHEETLRQLNSSSKITTILAEPAAAKRIRGWKYFSTSSVYALPPYSERKHDSMIRFLIPGSTPADNPGEATIAFIPARYDMTGLHNAVGITYRPPSSTSSFDAHLSNLSSLSYSSTNTPVEGTGLDDLPLTPPDSPNLSTGTLSTSPTTTTLSATSATFSSISSNSSFFPKSRAGREKTLSLIYSPHGVTYSLIRTYASSHLVKAAALPLTALLHSFDRVQNPWYLGGNISAGLPGGLEIAQNLLAKCWVSAHDEEKEDTGFSVKKISCKKYSVEQVQEMVKLGSRCGKVGMEVRVLGVGEEMVLQA
ncbi:hypothetical protein MMC12_005827 [Toensbergia leucococca]|nr:hypothetical protein [Toensbergia leucococca]